MDRCPLCPGTHNCVPPSGPSPCNIIFCGEAPGHDEDRKKEPFVGKTGREVNEHYLPLCGLRRSSVMITNAIHCLPDSQGGKLDAKREKDIQLLQSCAAHHLYPEIERCQPKLIVPMGAFACRAIDPDIDLKFQHGMPLQTGMGVVFPMYHPAQGIHEPKKMLLIRNDWIRLGRYLKGKLTVVEDEYAEREEYSVVESTGHLSALLDGQTDWTMAVDTESTRDREPFCLTLSTIAGTGYLIKASALDILEMFQSYLDSWHGPIVFHNWLYDLGVVTRMGLRFPCRLIKDTMQQAFHLGNLPQALKELAYRELGMSMMDFDDLVTPFSRELVLRYYREAHLEKWERPEAQLIRDPEEPSKWIMYQPQRMSTKLKLFFTLYIKSGGTKDVFKAWDNWEDEHQMVQERCGRWPGKCISHAWEKDQGAVIRYACRDADATLRLYPVLQHMRSKVRRKPQEQWGI